MKKLLLVLTVCMLGVAACGSDSSGSGDTTTTAAASGAGSSTTVGADEGGCPDETSLEIVTGGVSDGEIDVATAWSEGGNHPLNDVDDDHNIDFVFTDYEIPEDPQFGYSIPIAGSEVEDGGTEFSVTVSNPDETIEAGMSFVDQTADDTVLAENDGIITFISLFLPSGERAVLGETTLTIHEMTDEVICGEVTGINQTDLQDLTSVEGMFVADRLQFVEAEADGAAEE